MIILHTLFSQCLVTNSCFTPFQVWSFGVTLWEMFTFGASPYLHGCENFFKPSAGDEKHQEDLATWLGLLNDGHRLPKPEQCPAAVYADLMLPCWQRDPKQRPSFRDLGGQRGFIAEVELKVT